MMGNVFQSELTYGHSEVTSFRPLNEANSGWSLEHRGESKGGWRGMGQGPRSVVRRLKGRGGWALEGLYKSH